MISTIESTTRKRKEEKLHAPVEFSAAKDSPVSVKHTVLRPNWQYKASTAEMVENRYS